MSDKTTASSNVALYLLLAVFGFPFALIGLATACSVVLQCYKDIRIQFWHETDCQVIAATLVEEPDDERPVYRVKAQYRYEWEGKPYTGTRVYWMDASADSFKARHQRLFDELEKHRLSQQPIRCWVNPSEPTQAVLYRGGAWLQITISSLASILFGGIGFLLLSILASSFSDDRKVAKSKLGAIIHTNRPWMSRPDWALGEVIYSARRKSQIQRWLSFLILFLTTPGAIVSGLELSSGEWWAALGLIPAGIGVIVYLNSRRSLREWRHFGNSTLRMAACPGVVGGEFRAAIRPDRLSPSANGYEVKLKCEEIELQTGGEGSSRSVTTLFEDQREVLKELRDDAGTLWIPVLFHIPFSAPETVLEKDFFEKTWKLTVRSLTPGHGYQAEFEVPIFHTSESEKDFQPSEDGFKEFIAPVDHFATIKASGILVDTSMQDVCCFTFPARRHLGFAIAMLVVHGVFVSAVSALLFYFWKPGWIPVTSFLVFFLLWAILDALLYHSKVSVERNRLSVRSGLIALGRTKVLEARDIKEWLLVPAGSWGSTTAYNLGVQLKSKSTVMLAKRILPESIAKQLMFRMKKHMTGSSE